MIALTRVQACLADVLDFDADAIGGDTPVDALEGWDSVNAMRVLSHVERTFQVRLPLAAFADVKTVADIHRLINRGGEHAARS